MAKKKEPLKKIDQKAQVTGAPQPIMQDFANAPSALRTIPAPEDLVLLSQVVAHSAQSAQIWINVGWEQPPFGAPDAYIVEYGFQESFDTVNNVFSESTKVRVNTKTAALLAFQNRNYYIRVQAVLTNVLGAFTDVLAVTTVGDNTPAPDVSNLSADFTTGNLVITWDEPSSDAFKDAQIQIWNPGKTVLYGTYYSATGQFVWTEGENLRVTSGVGATSVLVEVASRSWSNSIGNVVSTTASMTVPSPVSSVVPDFSTGDLYFSWTNPNIQFKDIEVKIYADGTKAVLYRTIYSMGNNALWTVEQNFLDTGNNPDPNVYYEIKVRSWLNLTSTVVNGTAVKVAPSAVSGLTNTWVGDDGSYPANVSLLWSSQNFVKDYEVIVDGRTRLVTDPRFDYNYALNVGDHYPALPSGSPNLSYTVRARDRLNQYSAIASGNANNAAPNTAHFSALIAGGFSSIGGNIVIGTPIKDLYAFEWTLLKDSVVVTSNISAGYSQTFASLAPGVYQLQVKAIDLFGQKSAAITSNAVTLDALTIDELRAETKYTDSIGTSATILNRLKDGVLYDGSGNYQSYATNSGWRWVKASRALLERYRTVTLSAFWSSNTQIYFQVNDGSSSTYFGAPVTLSGAANSIRVLTKYTSQATAQANPVTLSGANGTLRFDFPQITEGRDVTMFFNNPNGTFGVYEYYPRRLVQSDDIEAESIRAINIAVGGITADRISTINLSALSANMGNLNMDGVINIMPSGGIYQGTGTFTTPITGLKIFNSGGIGKVSTYNGGIEQVTFDTDGLFKAGAGNVQVSVSGVRFVARDIDYYAGIQYNVAPNPNNIIWTHTNSYATQSILTLEGYYRTAPIGNPDGFTGGVPQTIFQHIGSGTGSFASVVGGIDFVIIDNTGTIKSEWSGFRFKGGDVTIENNAIISGTLYPTTLNTGDIYHGAALIIQSDANVQFWVNGGQRGYFTDTGFQSNLPANIIGTDAGTNSTLNTLSLMHLSTASPTTGFGVDLFFSAHSANNTTRPQFLFRSQWITATDASRTSSLKMFVYDATSAREAMRMESNGSAALLGFLGATAVVRQTGGAATAGGTYTATEQGMINRMYTALRNYGLLT